MVPTTPLSDSFPNSTVGLAIVGDRQTRIGYIGGGLYTEKIAHFVFNPVDKYRFRYLTLSILFFNGDHLRNMLGFMVRPLFTPR